MAIFAQMSGLPPIRFDANHLLNNKGYKDFIKNDKKHDTIPLKSPVDQFKEAPKEIQETFMKSSIGQRNGKKSSIIRTYKTDPHLNEVQDYDHPDSILTLSNFHYENKLRIFGSEWNNKNDLWEKVKEDIGNIGAVRPRRLEPLIPSSPSVIDTPIQSKAPNAATSTRLHLSVKFTSSISDNDLKTKDFDSQTIKRQNSMQDIRTDSFVENQIERPNSAPGKRYEKERKEGNIQDTPARANTPTNASNSTHFVKPQIMGLSYATNSPENSVNIPSTSQNIRAHLEQKELLKGSLKKSMSEVGVKKLLPIRKTTPIHLFTQPKKLSNRYPINRKKSMP